MYLIIGQVFAALIGLVSLLEPNAVTNLEPLNNNFAGNLIYFSLITLTTTGYGDIVPMHAYARGLVNIEAVIGHMGAADDQKRIRARLLSPLTLGSSERQLIWFHTWNIT